MVAIIKRGDKGDTLTLTVNMDLTGCTLRLLARPKNQHDAELLVLAVDPGSDLAEGTVDHITTGTLELGDYDIELEATRGDEIFSFPTNGFERLKVVADLG